MKFRRQHPIGAFIADFFCPELGLVIELDGGIHRESADADQRREEALISLGLIVCRLRNADVLDTPGRTLALLANVIAPLLPESDRQPLADLARCAQSRSRVAFTCPTQPHAPTQNAAPLTQNAAPLTQNAGPLTQNAAPLTQNAAPLTQNAAPLTQNAAPLTQTPSPAASRERAG